jgi:hypothetical protein
MQNPPPGPQPAQNASARHDSMVDAAMFKPPSKLPIVFGVLVGLFVGALVSGLVTANVVGSAQKGKSKVRVVQSASASAVASGSAAAMAAGAPAKGSLAERAAAGDVAAKKKLEAMPRSARTADETTALARAVVAAERKELDELGHKIGLVPKMAKEDKAVADRLKELVGDRAIATDALRMFASLPGNTGPDLLYAVVTASRVSDDTQKLAEDLLYAKDVRKKAALELGPILDLRKAESCEDVKKAIADVKRDADRRAFVPLIHYQNKRGCGDKKLDDCWPCLRDGDVLKDALTSVQKRPSPPTPSF